MLASILNKQVIIEKESTTTNRVGTPKETYVFLKECFAEFVTRAGTTQYDPYGQVPFSSDEVTLRYDKRIDYKCRILYKNDYYKIEHIEEMGRKHWMKLNVIVWERS